MPITFTNYTFVKDTVVHIVKINKLHICTIYFMGYKLQIYIYRNVNLKHAACLKCMQVET